MDIDSPQNKLQKYTKSVKSFLKKTAFFAQYYPKRFVWNFKKRLPQRKKFHINSFPAIHFRKLDKLDLFLKFSSDITVVTMALAVALCNLYFFTGDTKNKYSDNSL